MAAIVSAGALEEDVLGGVEALRSSGIDVTCRSVRVEGTEPPLEHCAVTLGGMAHGSAVHLESAPAARVDAAREAVARYAWFGGTGLRGRLDVRAVASLGAQALAVDDIAGYSPALRARERTALGWTRTTEFVWVEGRSLRSGASLWVPVQLVARRVPPGSEQPVEIEPELRPRVPTGVAAHPRRDVALLEALWQVIERDAFMITWLARLPTETLDVRDAASELGDLIARVAAAGLAPTILRLPTDIPIPVALVLLRDGRGAAPAVTLGVAARPTSDAAATVALARALGARQRVRGWLGEQRAIPRDTFRLDAESRLLWWADARRAEGLAWLTGRPGRVVPDDVAGESAAGELGRLVAWFGTAGEEIVAVDLVDEAAARRLGHHVVAVVAPGFHPVHGDEARPARWSIRLRTVPAALDLPPAPVLNSVPHPLGC